MVWSDSVDGRHSLLQRRFLVLGLSGNLSLFKPILPSALPASLLLLALVRCWPGHMKSLISLGRSCGDVMGLVHGEAVAFCQGQREACDNPVSRPVATEALGVGLCL